MNADFESIEPRRIAAFVDLQKAAELMAAGRYDLAERLLRQSLVADPECAMAHVLLGQVCFQLDRTAEARSEAKTALRIDPRDTTALLLLSRLERAAGKFQESERLLLDALRIDPQEPQLLLAYAVLMYQVGRLEKAERLTQSALRIDPDDEHGHALLANIRTERLQSGAAVASATQSLRLRPDSDVPHAALGTALFAHGRPFAARRHLREAVRIDPTDADVLESYRQVDRECRWTMLPLYYFSIVLSRIPGRQYTVWGLLVSVSLLPHGIALGRVWTGVCLFWFCLCLYSYVAVPLTSVWIKLFPAK